MLDGGDGDSDGGGWRFAFALLFHGNGDGMGYSAATVTLLIDFRCHLLRVSFHFFSFSSFSCSSVLLRCAHDLKNKGRA